MEPIVIVAIVIIVVLIRAAGIIKNSAKAFMDGLYDRKPNTSSKSVAQSTKESEAMNRFLSASRGVDEDRSPEPSQKSSRKHKSRSDLSSRKPLTKQEELDRRMSRWDREARDSSNWQDFWNESETEDW